jgi:chromosomal replication initiation ATPase DnaA
MIHPIQYIIELVSLHFGVSVEDIIGKCRKRELVEARHVAIYLIKKIYRKITLQSLGSFFAQMHHATVLHAMKMYHVIIQDSTIANNCFKIEQKIWATL